MVGRGDGAWAAFLPFYGGKVGPGEVPLLYIGVPDAATDPPKEREREREKEREREREREKEDQRDGRGREGENQRNLLHTSPLPFRRLQISGGFLIIVCAARLMKDQKRRESQILQSFLIWGESFSGGTLRVVVSQGGKVVAGEKIEKRWEEES